MEAEVFARVVGTHDDGVPFFVVVMPGILHILEPCLALLADHPITLVGNGIEEWEAEFLRSRHPNRQLVIVAGPGEQPLQHGDIIDALCDACSGNFGLLDPDCYVFEPSLLDVPDLPNDAVAAAAFSSTNELTGLTYPRTFLLVINSGVVDRLRSAYGVSCAPYRTLPENLRTLVSGHDGAQLYPYAGVPMFDTFHMVVALGYAERLRWIDMGAAPDAACHVGFTSYCTRLRSVGGLLGPDEGGYHAHEQVLRRGAGTAIYFHQRLLERPGNTELRSRYEFLFSRYGTAADTRATLAHAAAAELSAIDELLDRLPRGNG